MIGSGFSRNAKKINPEGLSMPLWWHLKQGMFARLYPDKDSAELDAYSSNPNRLAEEFELEFGAGGLEDFLREIVPDSNYLPGEMHKRLIEFPWSDILTTNYDTLLERSIEQFQTRHYSIVTSQAELPIKSKPRIIKLHGSFPNQTPFIITEEHFRIYPQKFSAFVNTAQQIMVENTLILIGFSGDDPNFMSWAGWVRDNLGENRQNIYLIGCFNFSKTQQRLLEERRIFPIDFHNELLQEKKLGVDIYELAIARFFDFLDQKRKPLPHLWPSPSVVFPNIHDAKEAYGNSIKEVISLVNREIFDKEDLKSDTLETAFKSYLKTLSALRETFPNWVVCPPEKSNRLWLELGQSTNSFFLFFDRIPLELAFNIFFEISWLAAKTQRTMAIYSSRWEPFYEKSLKLLSRINPFPGKFSSTIIAGEEKDGEFFPENSPEWNWDSIRGKWVCLIFLNLFPNEKNVQLLEALKPILVRKAEWRNWYMFEVINQSRIMLNWEKSTALLWEWLEEEGSPDVEVKKALFLFDYGFSSESKKVLKKNLKRIRGSLGRSPGSISFTALEGLIMRFFYYTSREWNLRLGQDEQEKLKSYNISGSDSWKNVWDYLEQIPPEVFRGYGGRIRKSKFDIGSYAHSSKEDSEIDQNGIKSILEYQNIFLLSGFPFRMFHGEIYKNLATTGYINTLLCLEKAQHKKDLENFLNGARVWGIGKEGRLGALDRNIGFIKWVLEGRHKRMSDSESREKDIIVGQFERSFLVAARLSSHLDPQSFNSCFYIAERISNNPNQIEELRIFDDWKTLMGNLILNSIELGQTHRMLSLIFNPQNETQEYFSDHPQYHPAFKALRYLFLIRMEDFGGKENLEKIIGHWTKRLSTDQIDFPEFNLGANILEQLTRLLGYKSIHSAQISTTFHEACQKSISNSYIKFISYLKTWSGLRSNILDSEQLRIHFSHFRSWVLQEWGKPYKSSPSRQFSTIFPFGKDFTTISPELEWEEGEMNELLDALINWLKGVQEDIIKYSLSPPELFDHQAVHALQKKLLSIIASLVPNEQLEDQVSLLSKHLVELGFSKGFLSLISVLVGRKEDIAHTATLILQALQSNDLIGVTWSLEAILIWAYGFSENKSAFDVPKDLIDELLIRIRYRVDIGLESVLVAVGNLVWNRPELLDSRQKQMLIEGLEGLFQEFQLPEESLEIEKKLNLGISKGNGNDFKDLAVKSSSLALACKKLTFEGEDPSILRDWAKMAETGPSLFLKLIWEKDQYPFLWEFWD